MCSVDPDEIIEMVQQTEFLDIASGNVVCRKCGTSNAELVLRVKDAYCSECFLMYITHKFRSTIGKSKLIKCGDKVLIVSSGDESSATLAHLIYKGVNDESHKKIRFFPFFLIINDEALCSLSSQHSQEEATSKIQVIINNIKSYNFSCYVTQFEHVLSAEFQTPVLIDKASESVSVSADFALQQNLQQLVKNCQTATAEQDLLWHLQQELICHSARSLGFQKVFVADTATDVAVRILSNIAQGRGAQVAGDVHFKTVHNDVQIFRPMRELMDDEIEHYVRICKLQSWKCDLYENKEPNIASRTRKFILGLQKDFPATIPTVFRTGDKLSSGLVSDAGSQSRCVLCQSAVDTTKGPDSAFQAMNISRKISHMQPPGTTLADCKCNGKSHLGPNPLGENSEDSSSSSKSHIYCGSCGCSGQRNCYEADGVTETPTQDSLVDYMCYGCQIIVREMNNVEFLPATVKAEAKSLKLQDKLKSQIEDFLL